ncbi:hypothetical protein, partial [Arthrobacter sp. UYCu712]|uniref:hypothetical protein n=1 Tax=Arthrobacter sp. UYCu712 TaxID=3156340 RepID=UPI0033984BD5
HGTLTLILGVSLGHNRYPSQKRKRHQTRYGSKFDRYVAGLCDRSVRISARRPIPIRACGRWTLLATELSQRC